MSSKTTTQPARRQHLGLYLVLFFILLIAGIILIEQDTSFTFFFAAASLVISWLGLMLTIVNMVRGRVKKTLQPAERQNPQLRPAAFEDLPQTPVASEAAFEYQQMLDKLQANITNVKARQKAVEKLIDDYFGQSVISSARYKQVMQSAQDVLLKNYDNAAQAVALFGSSRPTKARLAILQNYVDDSDDVVANIDRVIDELLKVQQSSVMESGDALDARLEELADTTVYYQKKEQS